MEATAKKQSSRSAKKQQTEYKDPKRLSKAGIWRRANPGGVITVLDRRAVNK